MWTRLHPGFVVDDDELEDELDESDASLSPFVKMIWLLSVMGAVHVLI
jgi:hypothetical protein